MRSLFSRPQLLWTAASSLLASKMVGHAPGGGGPAHLSTPLVRRRVDAAAETPGAAAAAAAPCLLPPRAFFTERTHDVALLGVNWLHQVKTVAALTAEAQAHGWYVMVPRLHLSADPADRVAAAALTAPPGPLTHQARHAHEARQTYERRCASEEYVARQVVDARRAAAASAAGDAPLLALVPPVFLYADSIPWRIRRLSKRTRVTTMSVEPGGGEDVGPFSASPRGEYVVLTFDPEGRSS